MTIRTIFESRMYRLDRDIQYGTNWFVRIRDDNVSLLNTGVEAEEEVEWAEALDSNNKQDVTLFNEIAREHSFSPRWSKVNG
jgi:hypothetical protein